MPLYEYQCADCSSGFEVRRSFNDGSTVACPRCQGQGQRLFSPVPIVFKGTGFYTTDSRKDDGAAVKEPEDAPCS